jgi:hypothetical protein
MLGISLYSYPQLAKMLCLSYYAYVFSSTKLEIKAEQILPESEGVGGRGWGQEAEGRNDSNNVCTCG